MMSSDLQMLRLPRVLQLRARQRTAHYGDIRAGLFTGPIRIGARAVAWPAHEVDTLNAARIAGKTDDQIRALVKSLEAARAFGDAGK